MEVIVATHDPTPEEALLLLHSAPRKCDAPLHKTLSMLLVRSVRQALQVIHHGSQERQYRLLKMRTVGSDPKDVAVTSFFEGHSSCGGAAFVIIAQVGEVVQQLTARLLLIPRGLGDGDVLASGLP